ncbi:MAG: hypothetical protein L6308_05620 [Candidatus Omnitrophica bacterium]|nr:hypothetical protein [Candidatus Omnitrophota bacterium]
MFIKRIASVILTVIFVAGALSEVFNWIGITPSHITNNKFIPPLLNFLNLKIPLYIVSLIILIAIILYRKVNRAKGRILSPVIIAKKTQEKTEEINLSKEQQTLLLSLLDESDRSLYRDEVEHAYKTAFSKRTSDFNIIENQLKASDLIEVRRYPRGLVWILTKEGLKQAGIIYKDKRNGS